MHNNPKLNALHRQQQNHVERLFSKDPPPPVAAETRAGAEEILVKSSADGDVVRKSYIILRGRIEALPNLELKNIQGQTRLFPWHYFGGADLDHPGELVLIFDGPEGSSRVTLLGLSLGEELKEGIKAQKVSLICELTELDAAAAVRAGEGAVTRIGIKGGGRDWNRGGGQAR